MNDNKFLNAAVILGPLVNLVSAGLREMGVSYDPRFSLDGGRVGDQVAIKGGEAFCLSRMARKAVRFRTADLLLSPEAFTERFLVEAAKDLVCQIAQESMLSEHRDEGIVVVDLPVPQGVDMSARITDEIVSIRLVRRYDIETDTFPCFFDILYGFRPLPNQSRISRLTSKCRRFQAIANELLAEEKAIAARHAQITKSCDEATVTLMAAHAELAAYIATGVPVIELPERPANPPKTTHSAGC